jgi:hypothetical protein
VDSGAPHDPDDGEEVIVFQVRFRRYRFLHTGDLGYREIRGAEG